MAKSFNPVKFDARKWLALAIEAGMKMTDYNTVDGTPFNRDVIGELAEECRKQRIKFGVCYSHSVDSYHRKRSWRNLPPPTPEYVKLVKGRRHPPEQGQIGEARGPRLGPELVLGQPGKALLAEIAAARPCPEN